MKKYVTCAYFSVSATWNWRQPASETASASECDDLGRERDLHLQLRLVLGHRDDEQLLGCRPARRRGAVEPGERPAVHEGVGQLPGAVGPEVRVDDRVAVADDPDRLPVRVVDDGRGDELVGLAAGVGGLDGRGRGRGVVERLPVDDRVVAPLRPVPALVAVHREVAAPDARDPGIGMGEAQPPLDLLDVAQRRARRGVPPVEQRVDPDARDLAVLRELRDGDEVAVVGMDPAGADEADDVQGAAARHRPVAGLDERGPLEEAPVGDGRVDPGQVLEHRTAGTEVQVADLGVAHLLGRQADVALGCTEDRAGPAMDEPVPGGHGSRRRWRRRPGSRRGRNRRG